MKFDSFTIIVTDDCNLNCSYCPQKKEKKSISRKTVGTTLDFFFPLLENEAVLSFYGGEPLLEFDVINEAVEWVTQRCRQPQKGEKNKRIDFSITTNGSLLNPKVMEFLNRHRFSVLLSFDSLAHHITRRENDFDHQLNRINTIINSYPDIKLKINSVFTPTTISLLSKSVHILSALEVRTKFTLSKTEVWDSDSLEKYEQQLKSVADDSFTQYKKKGTVLVENFRGSLSPPHEGLFTCNGCKKRMAVSPGGHLWGCFLFHDFYKGKEQTDDYGKYSLGSLTNFIQNHETQWPEKCANYSKLRIDNYWTENSYCFLCENVYSCNICPVAAVYTTNETDGLGYIPSHICKINKITTKVKNDFFHRIQQQTV